MKLRPCTKDQAARAPEAALLRAIQPVGRLHRTAYMSTADVPAKTAARRKGCFAGRGVLRSDGVTLPCDNGWNRRNK